MGIALHLSIGRSFVTSMTVLWFVAGVLLVVIHAMINDHVVFPEVPISVGNQDMESYHKTSRTHFHEISGKVVFWFILNALMSDDFFSQNWVMWLKCFSRYNWGNYVFLLVALYLLCGLYTFEDRKIMEVVLACFKGTVPATGWRDWGKLNTSVSIRNLYTNIQTS